MHEAAADHRRDHADRADLVERAGQRVALQHDEIGVVARQQPPRMVLRVARPGGSAPEPVECDRGRDRLGYRPVARDGSLHAAERVDRLDRRVGAEAQPRARTVQRAERVGRVTAGAPGRLGDRAVARSVTRLQRGDHADCCEARYVGGIEQLAVLDARSAALRLPARARRLEGVEDGTVRRIADRVHREVEPGAPAAIGQLDQLVDPEQRLADSSVGKRLEHRGRTRPERAVRERFDHADLQVAVAEAAAQAELDDLVEPRGGQRRPHPQLRADALPARKALVTLEVVDARDAAAVRRCHRRAHRLVEVGLAEARQTPPRVPRGVLAEDAGVAVDDALRGQSELGDRGGVEPQRVVVVREQCARPGSGRVERKPVRAWIARRPERLSPAGADDPALAGLRGNSCDHVGVAARGAEAEPPQRERPLDGVQVRVGEPRDDAAAL